MFIKFEVGYEISGFKATRDRVKYDRCYQKFVSEYVIATELHPYHISTLILRWAQKRKLNPYYHMMMNIQIIEYMNGKTGIYVGGIALHEAFAFLLNQLCFPIHFYHFSEFSSKNIANHRFMFNNITIEYRNYSSEQLLVPIFQFLQHRP